MKKNNKGFSLVELIVVIAIMAILAAVAVIGVSVYIPKAQQAADEQMFSDIENAFIYAGYAGTFEEGDSGYIIISENGIVNADKIVAGSSLDQTLSDAFGVDYKTAIKLSYDKWGNNGMLDGLSPITAFAVANSSYMTGNRVDDLLSDVEKMTTMAQNLVSSLESGAGLEGATLSSMFTNDDGCIIDATAAKYGITKGDFSTWEDWAADPNHPENKQIYSNLLVLTAADESEKKTQASLAGEDYEMSGASNMILEFSTYYAYAAQNPEFSNVLDDYMAHLNNEKTIDGLAPVTNATTGAEWFSSLKNAAGPGYDEYLATLDETDGQATMDKAGFTSILAGLGNPTDEQAAIIAGDLSNPNLFTNGVVNTMFNDYLDYVDSVQGMVSGEMSDASNSKPIRVNNGEVAILFVYRNGQVELKYSLPTE